MDEELIERHAAKAGLWIDPEMDAGLRKSDLEAFAALIAEECAKIVETRGPAMHGPAPVAAIIREKFGVKP